jgi:hypothetical protein
MSKTFQLSYDISGTNLSLGQLSGFMNDSRRVKSWYQPFIGTILIKSDDMAHELRESFHAIFGGTKFLVSPLDARSVSGTLDTSVWHWVYNDDETFLALMGREAAKSLTE